MHYIHYSLWRWVWDIGYGNYSPMDMYVTSTRL